MTASLCGHHLPKSRFSAGFCKSGTLLPSPYAHRAYASQDSANGLSSSSVEEKVPMPDGTHETVSTQFVQVGNIKCAYRRFGRCGGVPLVLLNYFAASMDDWDPKVTNGLAAEREVILFDNVEVASSAGETPSTVPAMAKDFLDFCNSLELGNVDLLGFSLGGMIAQQFAFEHPDVVRRMILLGSWPAGRGGNDLHRALAGRTGGPSSFAHESIFYAKRFKPGGGTSLCRTAQDTKSRS